MYIHWAHQVKIRSWWHSYPYHHCRDVAIFDTLSNWWLQPSWKIWVRQIGSSSQLWGESWNSCSKPPTSYAYIVYIYILHIAYYIIYILYYILYYIYIYYIYTVYIIYIYYIRIWTSQFKLRWKPWTWRWTEFFVDQIEAVVCWSNDPMVWRDRQRHRYRNRYRNRYEPIWMWILYRYGYVSYYLLLTRQCVRISSHFLIFLIGSTVLQP